MLFRGGYLTHPILYIVKKHKNPISVYNAVEKFTQSELCSEDFLSVAINCSDPEIVVSAFIELHQSNFLKDPCDVTYQIFKLDSIEFLPREEMRWNDCARKRIDYILTHPSTQHFFNALNELFGECKAHSLVLTSEDIAALMESKNHEGCVNNILTEKINLKKSTLDKEAKKLMHNNESNNRSLGRDSFFPSSFEDEQECQSRCASKQENKLGTM